jgi:hypothetical protein
MNMATTEMLKVRSYGYQVLAAVLEMLRRELREERGFSAAFGKRTQISELQQRIDIVQRVTPEGYAS